MTNELTIRGSLTNRLVASHFGIWVVFGLISHLSGLVQQLGIQRAAGMAHAHSTIWIGYLALPRQRQPCSSHVSSGSVAALARVCLVPGKTSDDTHIGQRCAVTVSNHHHTKQTTSQEESIGGRGRVDGEGERERGRLVVIQPFRANPPGGHMPVLGILYPKPRLF